MSLCRVLAPLAVLATIAGSAVAAEPETVKAPAVQAAPTAKQSPSDVVALVGKASIHRRELDLAVKNMLLQAQSQGQLPQEVPEEIRKQAAERALEQLIDFELIYQEAKKVPVADLEKQVDFKLAQSKAKFSSPEEFEQYLKAEGLTEKDLVEQIRRYATGVNFIEKTIADKITVSDDDVKKFYDENKARFSQEPEVRASHILIGVDAAASPEEKQKAKEKAAALLKEIKGGKDFAEAAKGSSTCPSKEQGGDLGFFKKGQMVVPFEQAAFALKPGDVSDVVETQFGYHIIKLTDRKDGSTTPLDEVKGKIGEFLKNQKVSQAVADLVTELRKKATIEKKL